MFTIANKIVTFHNKNKYYMCFHNFNNKVFKSPSLWDQQIKNAFNNNQAKRKIYLKSINEEKKN